MPRVRSRTKLMLAALSMALAAVVGSNQVQTQSENGRARRPNRVPEVVNETGGPFSRAVGGAESVGRQADRAVEGAAVLAAAAVTPSTLVLYDTSGAFGWLGELYAILNANLSSHFGTWTALPVQSYTAGRIQNFSAVIYVGSTYDEPIPVAFLDDALATTKPVIWVRDNIWQLTNRWNATHPNGPTFANQFGWDWAFFDTTPVDSVTYKNVDLRRYVDNPSGLMAFQRADAPVVIATARRTNGTTSPWAVRSNQLTYVAENPFVFITEGDRSLIFEDLLFEALAPATPERHRALVRLEDIAPGDDPAPLRAIADYLFGQGIPFSFGVSTEYLDPNGFYNGGASQRIRLRQSTALISAIRYMQSRGGVMIEHGFTHQYSNIANPYTAVTGDDFEFYRVVENPDFTLTWVGPLPGDTSTSWAAGRIDSAGREFRAAGLTTPTIFEFPHYSASAFGYRAVTPRFGARYERSLYFRGLLAGGAIDHSRLVGQRFSYVVRDVYGQKVLPENLGNVELEPFHQYPLRFPADIIDDARRSKVIRDGFASFYFHPFIDISYLRQTIDGIRAQGYTFVSPNSL